MITIRPLKMSDSNSLYAIYSNKKVTKPAGFLPFSFLKDINDQMPEWIKTNIAILKDEKVVGVITCDILSDTSISLGIMIHQQYWKQGIANQALHLYLNQLKTTKIKTIYADCLSKNIASQKLLESVGFQYKQDFKRQFPDFIDEKTCKLYIYEL